MVSDLLTHSVSTAKANYIVHSMNDYCDSLGIIKNATEKITNLITEAEEITNEDEEEQIPKMLSNDELYKQFKYDHNVDTYNKHIVTEWLIKENLKYDYSTIKRIQTRMKTDIMKLNLKYYIEKLKNKPDDEKIEKIIEKFNHKSIKRKIIEDYYEQYG